MCFAISRSRHLLNSNGALREVVRNGCEDGVCGFVQISTSCVVAKKLIAEGAIGEPFETECISHYELNPLIPWGWSHRIDLGGGRLSNNFTHKLSIILHALDATLIDINGEARNDMHTAPVVGGVHDFPGTCRFHPGRGRVGWH